MAWRLLVCSLLRLNYITCTLIIVSVPHAHAVKSFTELGPQLLRLPGVKYLLSEMFSQDDLERYFSCQSHCGGSHKNPTANQVPYNTTTLVQQQSRYHDLKTMNVECWSRRTNYLQYYSLFQNIQEKHNAHKQTKFTCNCHIVNVCYCYCFNVFLVPFLYLLTNFNVQSFPKEWPQIMIHRSVMTCSSSTRYASYLVGIQWARTHDIFYCCYHALLSEQ